MRKPVTAFVFAAVFAAGFSLAVMADDKDAMMENAEIAAGNVELMAEEQGPMAGHDHHGDMHGMMDAVMNQEVASESPEGYEGSHNGPYASASQTAKVDLDPTGPEHAVDGWVKFIKHPEGVKVIGYVSGLPQAGKHGIHIHEGSSCGNGGNAAGGHFNPHGVDHGLLAKDGHDAAHLGDMGNVEVDKYGIGTFTVDLPGVEFDGPMGIIGRAVILHEKEDDFGQPTGNAGGRIGCGIIPGKDGAAGSLMPGGMEHSH